MNPLALAVFFVDFLLNNRHINSLEGLPGDEEGALCKFRVFLIKPLQEAPEVLAQSVVIGHVFLCLGVAVTRAHRLVNIQQVAQFVPGVRVVGEVTGGL